MAEMSFGEKYQKATNSALFGVALAFVVDNVASAYATATAAGAIPITEPVKKPWGQIVAYVRAKEGDLIELCSPMGG